MRLGDANLESRLEASSDAVVVSDRAGVIRFANRQAESLWGYDRDDMVGQPIAMLVPESLRQGDAALRESYFAHPFFRPLGLGPERTGRRRDGTEFPVDFSVSHIETEEGPMAVATVRDITDLKTASSIAAGVEYSTDAIADTTTEGIITSWNPAAERIFGYSGQEIVGKSVMLLGPADRVDETAASLAKVRAGQVVDDYDSVRVRKDGMTFPVSLTISPIKDRGGTIVGVSTVTRDLTNRRQAEEDRRRADRFSALVESIGEAVTSSTPEGIITSWNPAAERLFGYSKEEMIGRSGSLLASPDRPGELEEVLGRISVQQSPVDIETMLVRKDGTLVPVAMTIAPIHDASGAMVGVSSIARDVTVRRTAELGLHQLVALLESSNAAIYGETDAIVGGTLDGIITSWNPGAERMFGYSSKEMIGQLDTSLRPTDRADEAAALLTMVTDGQAVEHYETVRVRRDGTTFPVSLTISPVRDAYGAVIGVSAIARDLTGQRRDRREIAGWRDKAFKWMEELEQFQRLSVMREFELQLTVIDLQQEIEALRRLAAPDSGGPDEKR